MIYGIDDLKKCDDYIAEVILTEHAEDVWDFITHDGAVYKDYSRYDRGYSMAEYVRYSRWEEFMEYLKDCH